MGGKAKFIFAVFLAFLSGWFARGYLLSPQSHLSEPQPFAHNKGSGAAESVSGYHQGDKPSPFSAPDKTLELNDSASAELVDSRKLLGSPLNASDKLALFQSLLNTHQFEDAIHFYAANEAVLALADIQQWRTALLQFLSLKLNNGETALFTELVDLWLQYDYSDIDVLLLMAKFNRVMAYYLEALQTYALASTYAYNLQKKMQVDEELQHFVLTRDAAYAKRSEWYELMNFYGQLMDLGLENAPRKFRYAELLLMHGDESTANFQLEALSLKPAWKSRVAKLRADWADNGDYQARQQIPAPGFESAIAMKPLGSHYLMEVVLNGDDNIELLVDTGASITMLTSDSFARLVRAGDWQDLGWRFFNTANGVARGRLMQVEHFQLGSYQLKDVAIAVQGGNLGDGVDGLLGMNVLNKFHFQINQDRHELMLTPR